MKIQNFLLLPFFIEKAAPEIFSAGGYKNAL